MPITSIHYHCNVLLIDLKINLPQYIGRVLDDRVITAPVIRSAIPGGSREISGSFTSASANDLALLLRAGALPAPLKVIEERTVGPDLGSDAISMGVSAGIFGALLVLAFMVGIYGRSGFIACVGLAINRNTHPSIGFNENDWIFLRFSVWSLISPRSLHCSR